MAIRKKVGLVLGSGSSRGWAHIGVIEALEAENIPIDYVAGSSVGSYVGALYASGSLKSLKDFVLKMDGKKVFSYFDVVFPRSGLLDGTKKLKELFSIHTDVVDFSELNIPVLMVATDLVTGKKAVLKSGDIFNALRATTSIPGLFAPVKVKDRWLVDGGLVDPVPVGVARALEADVVIAVDLNSGVVSDKKPKKKVAPPSPKTENSFTYKSELLQKMVDYYEHAETSFTSKIGVLLNRESGTPDILETVMTSINIMQERITRINLAVEPPDILLQPRLGQLKMMDFDQVEQTIEEGYLSVKEKLEDIKKLLEPA
ncbi:FIG00613342: Bacterial patatin-like phospholipase domain containing protein [Olavius algarvensis Delta 1 endosymbiont]|nr:FIG00613342: Bacterial patatin-like phospholipase domain containing protein [Olavius algarvensis Delta 1 endosymbiont]